MKFIGDFHIHSHFSIATSKKLIPEYLDQWARIKGITVVGTGDFTHPGWTAELREKLEPAEQGLFKLKQGIKSDPALNFPVLNDNSVRFLLTAEISNIYKRDGKTRKVHNVVFAPDFETVDKIQTSLDQIGNITSDGRPILGLDSRDLLEICLDASEDIFFIPAHIWTPWFSALGSKSGFDTIDQCYGDLTGHIHAVETGLSADPPMHWICSFLDKFTIISNSDAHSPEKLGREANLFNTELSYSHIIDAIKSGNPEAFLGTIEFFPEEGKYHYDGHRKCSVCWTPLDSIRHDDICTECGRKVTVGVMNRAAQLADRDDFSKRADRLPYHSLVPLKEIISEIEGVGPNSKKVSRKYCDMISKLGPELEILLSLDLNTVQAQGGELMAEAIRRLRDRQVIVAEGYDGEFGKIHLFADGELTHLSSQAGLFGDLPGDTAPAPPRPVLSFNLEEFRALKRDKPLREKIKETADNPADPVSILNSGQIAAAEHGEGPALVIAGPGTGKTRVLTQRAVTLAASGKADAGSILAVTFTNKAAEEMRERISKHPSGIFKKTLPHISTFHSLGYTIIRESDPDYADHTPYILDNRMKEVLLVNELGCEKGRMREAIHKIRAVKTKLEDATAFDDHEMANLIVRYESRLQRNGMIDLDDLICRPVWLLENDPALLEKYRQRFRWIMIDEYQDINAIQYRLVQLLAGSDSPNLMVIGDPDQAIYGFRGADVGFIHRFKDDYPRAAVYSLIKSYRCSERILQASGKVVGRKPDSFLEGIDEGLKIKISAQKSDRAEAEFIARSIEAMMGGLRFFSMDSDISSGNIAAEISSLSDFAVLCRTARQMDVIEKAFHDHSIPYQKADTGPVFGQPPGRQIVDFIRWSLSPDNEFFRHIILDGTDHSIEALEELRASLIGLSVADAVKKTAGLLFPGADPFLLKQLEAAAVPFGFDCERFIRSAAMRVEADRLNFETERVSLLTLHAAKGLEFSCVFIPGCEDGLLPWSLFKDQTADTEEEQRLLYVGMTRAKKILFLTHAEKRQLFGREYKLARSPFLNTIEDNLLERVKTDYVRKPKKDEDQLGIFE